MDTIASLSVVPRSNGLCQPPQEEEDSWLEYIDGKLVLPLNYASDRGLGTTMTLVLSGGNKPSLRPAAPPAHSTTQSIITSWVHESGRRWTAHTSGDKGN